MYVEALGGKPRGVDTRPATDIENDRRRRGQIAEDDRLSPFAFHQARTTSEPPVLDACFVVFKRFLGEHVRDHERRP
jgi:hypothetical protein